MPYNGQELAKKLGVDDRGYPTLIMADTSGKVVYAGIFKNEKIEQMIEKKL